MQCVGCIDGTNPPVWGILLYCSIVNLCESEWCFFELLDVLMQFDPQLFVIALVLVILQVVTGMHLVFSLK